MADPAITQDDQRLRQRAMRRLAIALTLIAASIVALALLDRYNAAQKNPDLAPSPPRETPAPPAQPPAAETAPPPSAESAKPAPPPPVVSNQETTAPSSAPSPATPSPSTAPETGAKKPPASVAPAEPAPSAPEHKPAATAQAPAAVTPAAGNAQPTRGFAVQVGVFTSPNNAHALQAKLAEKGVPTHTETRVVVGPFKDRAEAEAVVRQLKEMGLGSVIVPPPASQ